MNYILSKAAAVLLNQNAALQGAVLSAQRLHCSGVTWKLHEGTEAGSGGRGEEILLFWRKWNVPEGRGPRGGESKS